MKVKDKLRRRVQEKLDTSTIATQAQLEESHRKYVALYDFAPVGYGTFDQNGWIQEINLTAASQLGVERELLLQTRLYDAIAEEDREIFSLHLRKAFETKTRQSCELRLLKKDGTPFHVLLESIVAGENEHHCRTVMTDITERKRVEEALRISDERYNALFNHSLDLVYLHDFTGNFIDANPVALNLLGYSKAEILTLNFASLLPPDQVPLAIKQTEELKNTGVQAQTIEYQVRCKNGEYVYVETKEALLLRDGIPFAIQGIARHITDRKRIEEELKTYRDHLEALVAERTAELTNANTRLQQEIIDRKQVEEALRESEERYHALFAVEPDALLVIDLKTLEIKDANEAALRLYGYSREEFLTLNILLISAEPDQTCALFQTTLVGQTFTVPLRYHKRKDGSLFPVEISGCVFELGGRNMMYGTIRDITERKRVEEALRESEEKFKMLSEESPNMIFINAIGKIVYANRKCEEMMGYTRKEFYAPDFDFLRLIAPESREMIQANFSLHKQSVELVPYEYTLLTKDQKRINAIMTSKVITYERQQAILGMITDITERKRAEEALRESEEKFRVISEQSLMAINIFQDGLNKYVNQAFSDMSEYPIEETMAWKPKETIKLIHPDDQVFVVNQLQKKLAGEKDIISHYQYRGITKSGKIKWVEQYSRVITYKGRPAILQTLIDITDRKRAEEQLRLSEERYALAQRVAHIGSWDWNIQTGALHWSEQIEPLFGFGRGEFGATYEAFLNCVHPDDRHYVVDSANATIEKDTDYAIEHRIVWPDGTVRWMSETGDVIRDEHGKAIRMIGIVQDITNRKESERALRESEERYRSLFEKSPDAIFIADPETGSILDVNPAAGQLLLKPGAEIIGLHQSQLHPPFRVEQTKRIFQEHIQEAKAHSISHSVESVVLRSDGVEVPVSIRAHMIQLQGKNVLQGVFRDITERKQFEADLQKAKEAAEAANRAKSEFLANMSHEIRTPLNGILGYAQILKRDKNLTEKQQEALDIIQRSGKHLLQLINDILDLSKIEAGKLVIEDTNFHLLKFLDDLTDLARVRAQQKGITFVSQFAPDLPWFVKGDEKRLRQILLNLLSNAMKFTPQGTVMLRVKTGVETGRRPVSTTIRFEVEDTGIGIPHEKLAEIFQPFEQVRNTRIKTEGTGLGLAISRRLAEMMGSRVQIQSTIEKGSLFWLDVDLVEAKEGAMSEMKSSPQVIGYKGRRQKILLVDNRAEHLTMLRAMLLPLGFELAEAVNGHDAIAKVVTFAPDVILMDLFMPVMDGFEATKHIRQIPELRHIIIIAVSAGTFPETRQNVMALGCHDFLEKPVSVETLLEKLHSHLNVEWIYEDDCATEELSQQFSAEPIIPPPRDVLIALFESARKGDIMNIKKYAAHIEQLDRQFIPFATVLHRLVKGFEVNNIKRFIQRYMEERHEQ